MFALALALALALSGAPAAFAVDAVSDTGVSNTTDRVLTIWAKDSQKLVASDDQLDFQAQPDADAMPNVTHEAVFKLTKITPTDIDLSKVKPGNTSTYTEVANGSLYLRSEGGAVIINFSNPSAMTASPGSLTDTPRTTTGATSLTELEASATGWHSGQDAADDFRAASGIIANNAGTRTADGVYIIEDTGNSGWWVVVQIPTIYDSAVGDLTQAVNYSPVVYAKLKDAIRPQFNSYVNILNKTDSANPAQPTARFADRTVWEKDGMTKGEDSTFTATFTLNGLNEYLTPSGGRGITQLVLGYAMVDGGTASVNSMRLQQSSSTSYGFYIPGLTLTGVDSAKRIDRYANIDFGLIISDADDDSSSQYIHLSNIPNSGNANTEAYTVGGNGTIFASNYLCYYTNGTSAMSPVNGANSHALRCSSGWDLYPHETPGASQFGLSEAIANAIIPNVYGVAGGTLPSRLGAGSLASFNTLNYDSPSQVFSSQSNIRIELAVTYRMKVYGANFTAGARSQDVDGNDISNAATDVKPLMIGSTYGRAGFLPYDFATFHPAQLTYDGTPTGEAVTPTLSLLSPARYGMYSYVYTGAVNALKLDQYGKPLAGARFALMRRDATSDGSGGFTYANKYAVADGSVATNGPKFAVNGGLATTDAAKNSVWSQTTGADGIVRFDGVDPDPDSSGGTNGNYYLVELTAPTGYKDVAHDTIEGEANYGGALVKAQTLSFADHKAAADKGAGAAGYVPLTKVVNVPMLALPNTGGTGLLWLLATGTVLLLMAATIRWNLRRSHRKALAAYHSGAHARR
jgi:hypothetical protein